MIRLVEIKNLRGIQQGRLLDLTPLVVLVGPNGCGKSTLLEAMMIGAHPVPPEAVRQAVVRRSRTPVGARWLAWRAGDATEILIHVNVAGPGRGRMCRLAFERPLAGEVGRVVCNVSGTATAVVVRFTETGQCDYEKGVEFPEVVPDLVLVDTCSSEFQPLHELYTQAVIQGRRQQALSALSELLPGIRNIEILTEGDRPIVHLVFDHYSVPAALGGDGVHALLRLVLELAARPRGLVLLEEPEVHQHPASLRQSVRAILAAVRREIQVVLTTQSLELIDILLAESKPEDLQALSLYRLRLKDGELVSSRSDGAEVVFARQQIEDDLR